MILTQLAQEALNKARLAKQEELRLLNRTLTQTEVFSDKLIDERLNNPINKAISRFEEALGFSLSFNDSVEVQQGNRLTFTRTCNTNPGDNLEEIFDTILSCGNEHTAIDTKALSHFQTWRVGAITYRLLITCPLPHSYYDLLKGMGKIENHSYGNAYETINCSAY